MNDTPGASENCYAILHANGTSWFSSLGSFTVALNGKTLTNTRYQWIWITNLVIYKSDLISTSIHSFTEYPQNELHDLSQPPVQHRLYDSVCQSKLTKPTWICSKEVKTNCYSGIVYAYGESVRTIANRNAALGFVVLGDIEMNDTSSYIFCVSYHYNRWYHAMPNLGSFQTCPPPIIWW